MAALKRKNAVKFIQEKHILSLREKLVFLENPKNVLKDPFASFFLEKNIKNPVFSSKNSQVFAIRVEWTKSMLVLVSSNEHNKWNKKISVYVLV